MATSSSILHRNPIATPSTPTLRTNALSQQPQQEGLECAGRVVDNHLKEDASFRELSGQFAISSHTQTNFSGHAEVDYPKLVNYFASLDGLPSVVHKHHVPLPSELLQEFQNLECNCAMGLFPEIARAWLTIDSVVYIWNYEDGKDLAYFDGLNQVVLCVGLATPKEGVFQPRIQYVLLLATAVEIVLLGVCFSGSGVNPEAEMHLQPEPLFNLPTDNMSMLCVETTVDGRIFLGGKNGCLYEVVYQAREGWFSRKCSLVNHSSSFLSYLVPSFLSFTEEDPIAQLVVDSSRQVLYSRSYGSTITVYYLGKDGRGISRVAYMSMDSVVSRIMVMLNRSSDHALFQQLAYITVLPTSESSTLHMLAVTNAGIRLYFTTTPNGTKAPPSLLALVHVRFPPGFSSSTASHRHGNNIKQVFYRRGALLLTPPPISDRSTVMVVRPDLFPFQQSLLEAYDLLEVEGSVWAMAETVQVGELEGTTSPMPLPPAVVTQHATPPRELVVIGTKGSYLLTCLRPVEQLHHLLTRSKSGASPALEEFFKLHREVQACAMCLVIATGGDQQLSSWATEAFFKYGGEPEMVQPAPLISEHHQHPYIQPGGLGTTPTPITPISHAGGLVTPSMQPGYNPQAVGVARPGSQGLYGAGPIGVSTPQSQPPNFSRTLGGAVVGLEVKLSGRHQGLCRYLARLLRPLWDENIVQYRPPSRTQPEEQFSSQYSPEELGVFLEHILSFKTFFERNTQLLTPPLDKSITDSPGAYSSHFHGHQIQTPSASANPAQLSFLQRQRSEASMKEHDSTRHLYHLVMRCFECLSLWRLLCERQFPLVVAGLSKDMKERLKITTFKTLVLTEKELSTALISSLMARHSGEVGVTDEIASRLRETTPSLFSQSNAIIAKANELVSIATATEEKFDQLSKLRDSVKLYSQVSQELPLCEVCGRYERLRFYEGVVDLSLAAANLRDPQKFAVHYYKSGQPSDDAAGFQALMCRHECYKCITAAMKKLLEEDRTPVPAYTLPAQPGPPPPHQQQTPPPKQYLNEMMTRALHSDDELFHVALYDWMLLEGLSDLLVEMKTPFLESYLKYKVRTEQDSRPMLDLLWRFYEKKRDYGAAAKILNQLAHFPGSRLCLTERIEYLSRAMVCAKSCNLPTASSHEGDFLHQLEESMEVARIQLAILDALKALGPSSNSAEVSKAEDSLNSELMDITNLYEHFAEKFSLAECKLAIVHCAGHHDPTLIESLWMDILSKVLRSSSTQQSFESVRVKVLQLSSVYGRSQRFFPRDFLILTLEKRACELRWDIGSVSGLVRATGVALPDLFRVYDKLFKAKDPFWSAKGDPLHLLRVICAMLLDYVRSPISTSRDRHSFHSELDTAISQYLVDLPSLPPATPHSQELMNTLHIIQREIQNCP